MAVSGPAPRGDLVPSGILGLLGTRGPTSRVDIARSLGVSPATVTQVTKDLIADRLVEELSSMPSRGGRPARLLGLVGRAGVAIGVKVTADHVACVTVGQDGSMRDTSTHPFDPSAVGALDRLGDLLARLVDAVDEPVLGVGVGVPGSVDAQASGVVDGPTLGWRAVPVGSALRSRLGVPVLVDNDVNTLAAAERLYGVGREHSSYLVVTIGRGVGCGIVLDGAVYRGAAGGAGEIGHTPVTEGGPRCGCGVHGCLEAHVGAVGLLAAARAAGVVGPRGRLAGLRRAARADDPGARAVYADAGRLLGRAMAGIVHTLDPQVVVLMGEGIDAWEFWAPGFEAALRSCLLPARRGLPVLVQPWSEDHWARGAASLVLASPFDAAGTGGEQGRMVRDRLSHRPVIDVRHVGPDLSVELELDRAPRRPSGTRDRATRRHPRTDAVRSVDHSADLSQEEPVSSP